MAEYDLFEKGKKEARIGLDSEKEIVKLINSDDKFRELIFLCINKFGFKLNKDFKAIIDKSTKSDILLTQDDLELGISVKSSSKTSFHQLDRRTLDIWRKSIKIPENIYHTLKTSILRVTENPKKNKFIIDEDQELIRKFFLSNLKFFMIEIFTRNETNLKFFLVNNKMNRKIYIFSMKDVLKFLINDAEKNFSFSNKGIIKLGSFISVQRKGGNGKRIKIPKTDWEHPGNNLQFKFKPLDFANFMEESNTIERCIINY